MSTLYVVATPIGNLDDISPRVSRVLAEVDIVAAEDTRRTGQLLKHLGISADLIPLHDHNEGRSTDRVIQLLLAGKAIALVSDAGTPLISDPGYDLVRQCHTAGVAVVPVPGPSSLTTALSVAGIPTDRFTFEGFVPAKPKARRDYYRALAGEVRTMVMFETPHRIRESLEMLASEMGAGRSMTLCRELTKTFEQIVHGSAGDLFERVSDGAIPVKGEFVLVVAGAEASQSLDADPLLVALLSELSPSRAAAVAARLTDDSKSTLYGRALVLKDQLESGLDNL